MVATIALLAAPGCGPKPPERQRNTAKSAPVEQAPVVPNPLAEPQLDREQLIFDAMRALSAAALGHNDSKEQAGLKGREFELRMRFGCPGLPTTASRSWSYDGQKHVLRARISADVAAEGVPASDLLLKGYEGVAGFVVEQPLLLSAGCPAPQFGTLSTGEPTIAVAQLFTAEDSRVQRPEKTYEITKAIDESARPTQGLDLVASGRLDELSDGRVIHCAFADGPPACLVAAKFDRIAIENPVDGSVLDEWSNW